MTANPVAAVAVAEGEEAGVDVAAVAEEEVVGGVEVAKGAVEAAEVGVLNESMTERVRNRTFRL